jgi:hypothetical protein
MKAEGGSHGVILPYRLRSRSFRGGLFSDLGIAPWIEHPFDPRCNAQAAGSADLTKTRPRGVCTGNLGLFGNDMPTARDMSPE